MSSTPPAKPEEPAAPSTDDGAGAVKEIPGEVDATERTVLPWEPWDRRETEPSGIPAALAETMDAVPDEAGKGEQTRPIAAPVRKRLLDTTSSR